MPEVQLGDTLTDLGACCRLDLLSWHKTYRVLCKKESMLRAQCILSYMIMQDEHVEL